MASEDVNGLADNATFGLAHLMISQKTRYAFRALFYLARSKGPVSLANIAANEKISRKFLELVMIELKRHRLVMSSRGKKGGYELARPANEISYAEVIRVMDGPLAMVPCASVTAHRQCRDCYDPDFCAIRSVLMEVRQGTAEILERHTLSDFLGILPKIMV
jgi:Rrf2 family protein